LSLSTARDFTGVLAGQPELISVSPSMKRRKVKVFRGVGKSLEAMLRISQTCGIKVFIIVLV
jgi:hypothetical protein